MLGFEPGDDAGALAAGGETEGVGMAARKGGGGLDGVEPENDLSLDAAPFSWFTVLTVTFHSMNFTFTVVTVNRILKIFFMA